jgi:hypothetical protein
MGASVSVLRAQMPGLDDNQERTMAVLLFVRMRERRASQTRALGRLALVRGESLPGAAGDARICMRPCGVAPRLVSDQRPRSDRRRSRAPRSAVGASVGVDLDVVDRLGAPRARLTRRGRAFSEHQLATARVPHLRPCAGSASPLAYERREEFDRIGRAVAPPTGLASRPIRARCHTAALAAAPKSRESRQTGPSKKEYRNGD